MAYKHCGRIDEQMTGKPLVLGDSGGGKREVLDKIINSKVLLTLKEGESGDLIGLIGGIE
ncbi:MAG: hypothetical protein ACLTZT_17600 [Butyricimonas faecalis]